jgi:galactan 5-O-arabinofuranosyltransferase
VTSTLAPPQASESTPTEPPVTRLGPGRTCAELGLGLVLAVLVSFAVQLAASRMHIDPGTNVPTALTNLGVAAILVVLFALIGFDRARQWPTWAKLGGAWAALSALTTLMLAVPLQATRFYLEGSSVDNTFRLQYLERMASTGSLADLNYHGVAPYYPGGWFWLGGRFANLIGWDGWAAYKPYAITWIALAPVVGFVLWSLVVNRRLALLATLPTVFAGFISVAVDEPYAWPSSVWLPPIAVLAWKVFRRRDRVPAWPIVLIGVYLGFCGITYTLHLVFGVLVVVVLAVIAGVLEVRDGGEVGPMVRRLLLRLVGIGVLTGVLSLITWGPFILAGGLGRPNVAAHFLPDTSANFPTPFVPDSVFGVLCLAGLVWVVVRARRQPVALVLLVITALVYCWFALSTLALLGRTTLLAFRFVATLDIALSVAGVFAAVELIRALGRHVRPIAAAGFALALAGALTLAQTGVSSSMAGPIDTAESDYYANGFNAKGQHDPTQDGAWTGELISTINSLSGRAPTGDIVLSAYDRLLSFQPYWGFQQTTPQYANPLGDYAQRNDEIRHWAAATGPADLLARLAANPHEPPNVFVFRTDGDALIMPIASDSFPQAAPVHVDDVRFDPELFDSPRFTRQDVGPFTVIVER